MRENEKKSELTRADKKMVAKRTLNGQINRRWTMAYDRANKRNIKRVDREIFYRQRKCATSGKKEQNERMASKRR